MKNIIFMTTILTAAAAGTCFAQAVATGSSINTSGSMTSPGSSVTTDSSGTFMGGGEGVRPGLSMGDQTLNNKNWTDNSVDVRPGLSSGDQTLERARVKGDIDKDGVIKEEYWNAPSSRQVEGDEGVLSTGTSISTQ